MTIFKIPSSGSSYDIIEVSDNFKIMNGCYLKSPIEVNEVKHGSEICCMYSRSCCFFCIEESCPIKEKYAEIINYYSTKECDGIEKVQDNI